MLFRCGRAVLVVLGVILLVGCAKDQGSDSKPSTAAEIVGRLRCADLVEVSAEAAADEPVQPREELACRVGEHHVSVRVYRDDAERKVVMNYLNQFDGYRVIDANWIAAVDTPEAADIVSLRTGGSVVELESMPTTTR